MGAKGSGISILQCQWLQRGALQLAVRIPQFAVLIPQFAVLFPRFLVAVPAFLVVVLACVPSCGYTPDIGLEVSGGWSVSDFASGLARFSTLYFSGTRYRVGG